MLDEKEKQVYNKTTEITNGGVAMQCEMARQFFDMLTVITAKQKIPKEYADGQVLYNAEIELLEKIYQYPEANISILSVKLGVTKSAVTQMSIKLLDKELIEKFQDSKNKKEKYFRLTNEGKKARETYMAHHDQALNEMRAYLCSLNENDKNTILTFMKMMKQYMPVYTFPCQCGTNQKSCCLVAEDKRIEEKCLN